MRAPILLSLSLLAACGGSGTVSFNDDTSKTGTDVTVSDGSGDGTTDGEDPEEIEDWTGSTLIVDSPVSGEVLPYGEDSDFVASVLDASGNETDFDDLVWTTNASDWSETGADFASDGLDIGTQAISVEATLPDGTLLRNTVGGVRVQHPDTGTYVGNLAVDISGEFNDFPITAACIGAAIVEVDLYGETATGDSTCIVSLLGFTVDALHVFDFAVDGDEVYGNVSLDLSFFQLEFEVAGALSDGVVSAQWATDYAGLVDVAGAMELERLTTEVSSGE